VNRFDLKKGKKEKTSESSMCPYVPGGESSGEDPIWNGTYPFAPILESKEGRYN